MDVPATLRGPDEHAPGVWGWALQHAGVPDDLPTWERRMRAELARAKYDGGRLVLAGSFGTDAHLEAWLDIARAVPGVDFHAISPDSERLERLAEPDAPDNFRWNHPDDDEPAARRGHDTGGRQ